MKPPPQPNEEGLPPGSYLKSCNGCRSVPLTNLFYCTQCTRGCGKVVESDKAVVDRCASFGNDNGHLVCEEGAGFQEAKAQLLGNAEGVPEGPYLESCGGCRAIRDEEALAGQTRLACSGCLDWHGATHASSLILESCLAGGDTVGNENGVLVCAPPPLPKGAYKSSCRDCRLAKAPEDAVYFLRCRCRDAQENLKDAVLYPPPGQTGFGMCNSIDNQNGALVCDTTREPKPPDQDPLPRGSYEESCRECTLIDGNTEGAPRILACRCSNEKGSFRFAILQLGGGGDCVDIDNRNGELICVLKDEKEKKKGEGERAIPKGNYKETCLDCRVDIAEADAHRNLICRCRTEEGALRYSMLQMGDGACEDIDNQNGELVCVKLEEREQDIGPEVKGESESSSVVDEL